MSSMVLKKPHGAHKAGDVISVPFLVGKQLIKDGVAIYLTDKVKEDAARVAVAPALQLPTPSAPAAGPAPPAEERSSAPPDEKPSDKPGQDANGKPGQDKRSHRS